MNNKMEQKDVIQFLLMNHQHIHENIKFADQKASALIAVNSGLLALTYSLIQSKIKTTIFLGFTVSFFLAIAIAFSFWVIKPRGGLSKDKDFGVIDPKRIAKYKLEEYLNAMNQLSIEEFMIELKIFIYDRAFIDEQKYYFLKFALIFSFMGWILNLLFAIFIKLMYS
jgi:hypothetical protein